MGDSAHTDQLRAARADRSNVFWDDLNNILWVSTLFVLGLVGIAA